MGINSSINDWTNTNSYMDSINQQYETDLNSIMDAMKYQGMSPGLALWLFQTRCMPDATNSCEAQIKLEADALNVANAIRNDVTNAQNDWNQVVAYLGKPNDGTGYLNGVKMYQDLSKLENDLHIPGITKILGGSNIQSLSGFIQTIKTNVDPPAGYSSTIANNIYDYIHYLYNQAAPTQSGATPAGPLPPQFATVTQSFNSLNQSVSGISSSIQAQMQYLNQSLQQYFGIYKSFFDSYSQFSSYIINKTNSN